MSTKAGVPVDIDKLQSHVLARGNVRQVVQALVAASRANIDLSFERAAAIDLAGRGRAGRGANERPSQGDRLPQCAGRGRGTMDAVAKDGIQLKCRARVTVRTNLATLVGGATEETVIARVGEGIVAVDRLVEHAQGRAGESAPDLPGSSGTRASTRRPRTRSSPSTSPTSTSATTSALDSLVDKAEAEKKRAQGGGGGEASPGGRARAGDGSPHDREPGQGRPGGGPDSQSRSPVRSSAVNLGIMDYYNLRNVQADTKMRDGLASSMEPQDDDPQTPEAR